MRNKKTLLSIALVLATAPLMQAQITLNTGTWFSESSTGSGVTNNSTGSSVSLLNSSGVAARIGAVAGLSQTVSLSAEGDFIQVVGNYSGGIGNNVSYSIRIGFYDASGLTIDQDYDADMDSLIGNFAGLATRSSIGAATGILNQPANASSQVLGLNQGTPPGNSGMSLIGTTVTSISTGNRTITYRVERIAGDILQFSLNDGVNINITRTQAVASASTIDFDSIAVGFVLANNTTGNFSDIVVTAIPEPSTYAALLGLGVLGFVIRRRMRK